MKKTLIFSALCAALLFGAEQNGYLIEADGEFGKELEALVAKYDNNVSVRIIKNTPENATTKDGRKRRLINFGVDKSQDFNLARGEELYKKTCQHCHGEKGQSRAYATSRKLSEMTAEQINDAFIGYANNPDYGGEKKNLMQPYAVSTSYYDLGDIISYIKGENAFVYTNEENRPISKKPTEQGTYIE